jgi:predicted MFS family arabinose efflux permease
MDMQRTLTSTQARRGAQASLWIATTQIAVLYAGSTLLTPLYRLYREAFGFSQLTLTLIYSAYVLGNLSALLLLGRLSDQIGRRTVNLVAIAIAAIATLLFLFASSVAWLFAGRVVSGLAIGLGAAATTAWLAELTPDKRRATVFATEGNFIGLAAGALPAGLLAAYLPWPLRLSYVIYLGVLAVVVILLARAAETVPRPVRSATHLSLRPRIGVPRELFGSFVAPAAIGFATFAVIGYYLALIPSLMAQALNQKNPAAGSAVVALLSVLGAGAGLVTRGLSSRTAMLAGSALLLAGVALLPCAEAFRSLALLLCGTIVTGPATMLAYRGSLEVINHIAPSERRAEIIASYILFMYAGNSLPIIGIGLLSGVTSSLTADVTFAIVIAACAVLALIMGAKRLPRSARPAR